MDVFINKNESFSGDLGVLNSTGLFLTLKVVSVDKIRFNSDNIFFLRFSRRQAEDDTGCYFLIVSSWQSNSRKPSSARFLSHMVRACLVALQASLHSLVVDVKQSRMLHPQNKKEYRQTMYVFIFSLSVKREIISYAGKG